MKKTFTIIIVLGLLLSNSLGAQAASPTPTQTDETNTPTPTTVKEKQIEDLKERLATKVAELREIHPRAMAGRVKATSVSTMTIETATKDVKIELTDDISVFQMLKGKRTKLTIDDVAVDDKIVVFGQYDTTLDILKAKVIVIQGAIPEQIHGTITDADSDAFTITVKTQEDRSVVVDVEKATVTNIWNAQSGIAKSGFSKLIVGDSVHVLGTPVSKKENRLSAIRVLDVGNMTSAPISVATPSPTSSAEGNSPTLTKKPTPTPKKTPAVTPTNTPEESPTPAP